MQTPPTKFIQKRNKKKVRYEKMLRKRNRTLNNVPAAQFSVLEQEQAPLVNGVKIHKLPLDFQVGEKDNNLYFDPCMLNEIYHTNCVDITYDGERIVTIRLRHKNPVLKPSIQTSSPSENEVKTEESNEQQFLNPLAQGLNDIFESRDNEMKGRTEEDLKRYNAYLAHRKELFSTKACYEIKRKVDGNGNTSKEISYSSKLLALSGFSIEEFIETVLKSGIPTLANERKRDLTKFSWNNVVTKILSSFEQPQVVNNYEELSIINPQSVHKKNCINMFYGNFIKDSVELTNIICIEEADSIPKGFSFSTDPFIKAHARWRQLENKERRQFLKQFYPKEYSTLTRMTSNTPSESDTEETLGESECSTVKLEEITTKVKLEAESSNGSQPKSQIQTYHANYYPQEIVYPSLPSMSYVNMLRTLFQSYQ